MTGTGIQVINPATGQVIADYPGFTAEQVELALTDSHAAQARWAAAPIRRRGEVLAAVSTLLTERRDGLASQISLEMGKPLAEALAEIDKCAWACDHYAQNGPACLADEPVAIGAAESFVSYEALGVILAIMPWNFPFWQFFRFAAPALMAGNGALLKHSPNVSGCALAMEALLQDAGCPAGLVRALLVADESVAGVTEQLIADPRIAAVTLTGSERAGQAVGAAAGRAVKKCVLELGGSDPFIVLADADLAEAAAQAARSRFANAGQSCIAAKRFIVAEQVAGEFERLLAAEAAALRTGDPFEPETTMGPLARADLLEALDKQVRQSVADGARAVVGGYRLDRPGFFYAATVLADVSPRMTIFRQETFGPVAAVIGASDEDAAVALANESQYGLGASVWTSDPQRGLAMGRRVRSGVLSINAVVASDPRLPFGGIKRSGYGRELGEAGIREFVNMRSVRIGPMHSGVPRQASRDVMAE
jgi:succinate-semialdehyde dehydrogenase/glutarate-semialdehyde dehydrogenase